MATLTYKKSMAIAAAGSLALTGLAAAPAQAAVSFTTAPIEDTSYNAILGSEFVLQTTVADAGSGTDVKFMVTGITSAGDIAATSESVASIASLTADATVDDAAPHAVVTQLDGTKPIVIDPTAEATTALPYVLLAVGLVEAEVEERTTITVTPFTDGNDDDVYDADLGEVKGSSVSITFIPTDEVTVTATQSVSVSGDTVTVNAAFDNINNGSIRSRSTLDQLMDIDIVVGSNSADVDFEATDFDATDNRFESAATAITVANDSRVVTTIYAGEETDAATVVRTNLAGSDVDDFESSTAVEDEKDGGEDIRIAQTNSYFLHDNSSSEDVLRTGAGTLTASVVVEDSDNDNLSGETVTWTISEVGNDVWDSGVSVTAGGETLENDDSSDAEEIEVTSVTNADGEAFVTFTYAGLDDGNQIKLTAEVENSGLAAADRTLTGMTPENYEVYVTNVDSAGSFTVDESESYTVNLSVRDEFGFAPSTTSRVELWVDYTSARDEQEFVVFDSSGNGSFTATAPSVSTNQNATLKLLDIDTADGVDITGNELDLQDSDGDYGNDYKDVDLSGQTTMTVVNGGVEPAVEIEFVTAESHDDATALAIKGQTLYSVDTRLQGGDEFGALTALADPSAVGVQSEATALVTDQYGVALAGAAVTFSGSGIEFTDETGEIQGLGSLTVYTGSDGKALVAFASNTAGDAVITATTGSLSDTLDINVDNSTTDTDFDSWSISNTAAYVREASTINFVATALDKYGNAIDLSSDAGVTVEYDGPGIAIPNVLSALTATNDDGEVKVSIVLGANDTGTHTVTVTHDVGTSDKTDDVSATYTFTIGDAPTTTTQKVNAGSFKGYVAVYARGYEGQRLSAKIGNDWVIVDPIVNNQEEDTLFRVTDFTGAGYDIQVRIYIDRVLVDTIPLTTK